MAAAVTVRCSAVGHFVDFDRGQKRRHHPHETVVQQAIRRAVVASGIAQWAMRYTLRHSFATHVLEPGSDIRTVRNCADTAAWRRR